MPLPSFHAIVFDMDGTLLDSEVIMNKAEREASKRFGVRLTEAVIHRITGLPEHEIYKVFCELYGESFPLKQYRETFFQLIEEEIEKNGLKLKPGVLKILDWCEKKGIRKAIATSTSEKKAKARLATAGIDSRFDALVGGDAVKRGKPAPDIYLQATKELHTAPEVCLAIEDSYNGIRSAHAAGMVTIMIPDLLPPTDEIRSLTYAIVSSLEELLEILRDSA